MARKRSGASEPAKPEPPDRSHSIVLPVPLVVEPLAPPAVLEVLVYPAFNALYYSGFVQGLIDAYGAERLTYTREGFPDLGHDCLAFRVRTALGERKVYIHAHDSTSLAPDGLRWADVFGKINLDAGVSRPDDAAQVLPVGPTIPVRVFTPARAAVRAMQGLAVLNGRLRSYRQVDFDLQDVPADRSLLECYGLHLVHYAKLFTHRRLPLSGYRPGRSRAGYVFFSSGLWPETHRVPEWEVANTAANRNRLKFIQACRSLDGVEFEGGFWDRKKIRVKNYGGFTDPLDYPHETYIAKTQESAVVFNTPAYKMCHSWKFAEFMALGKAIVSLPIVREMPAPLVHGEHMHFVDGSIESIRDAVERICHDDEYRTHLEGNARAYYERWLAPSVVIQRLVATAFAAEPVHRTPPSAGPRKRERYFLVG